MITADLIFGHEFDIRWDINEHFPHRYDMVFEDQYGDVRNHVTDELVSPSLQVHEGYIYYWYIGSYAIGESGEPMSWDDELVKKSAMFIERNIKFKPSGDKYDLAIHHREMGSIATDVNLLMERANKYLKGLSNPKVFILADQRREDMLKLIPDNWNVTMAQSKEMSHDKDRGDPEDMERFIKDYLTLNDQRVILTSSSVSTIVDLARAKGATVFHTGYTREDLSCYFSATKPQSFLKI